MWQREILLYPSALHCRYAVRRSQTPTWVCTTLFCASRYVSVPPTYRPECENIVWMQRWRLLDSFVSGSGDRTVIPLTTDDEVNEGVASKFDTYYTHWNISNRDSWMHNFKCRTPRVGYILDNGVPTRAEFALHVFLRLANPRYPAIITSMRRFPAIDTPRIEAQYLDGVQSLTRSPI